MPLGGGVEIVFTGVLEDSFLLLFLQLKLMSKSRREPVNMIECLDFMMKIVLD
tara:strand:+ start:148 stop:306 length:159 start_codon:yes stop_codon:yes gene_type:complete